MILNSTLAQDVTKLNPITLIGRPPSQGLDDIPAESCLYSKAGKHAA
jgi:hypothetical protein